MKDAHQTIKRSSNTITCLMQSYWPRELHYIMTLIQILSVVWLSSATSIVLESASNTICSNDYQQSTNITCSKNWTMFTKVTLIWALHDTTHSSDVLHTVLHYVSALLYKCSAGSSKNVEDTLYRSVKMRYLYYPCGQMSDSLHPIAAIKTWQIRVPKNFAVNITFVEFFLDEPTSKNLVIKDVECVLNNVTIQYYNYNYYVNGTLCNIPDRTHCSWKRYPPWSVVVPSHHVVLHLTSVMVNRHYKVQYTYEVVEKCSDNFYFLIAHHIKYRRCKCH